jgi:hypothetical protein
MKWYLVDPGTVPVSDVEEKMESTTLGLVHFFEVLQKLYWNPGAALASHSETKGVPLILEEKSICISLLFFMKTESCTFPF